MKRVRNLIIAMALAFLAITILMATIQYSSDLISVRVQPENSFSSDVNVTDLANNTDPQSSGGSGALQTSPPEEAGNGIGNMKLPSMSLGDENAGGPSNKPPDSPNYLLIILMILVVLVFLAVIGLIIWHRRRHARNTPALETGSIALGAGPGSFEGDYRIRFPQIREPFTITWGVHEVLEVVIESIGEAKDDVVLLIDGKVVKEISLAYGKARIGLELDKGDHRLTVSAKYGDGPRGPSWTDIRIVDYREEIVRMFNELYRYYRSCYEEVGDEMTPRELERSVRPYLPEQKRKALDVAVTIFEFANYSLHAMRRRDYEMMYLSKMDVAQAPGGQSIGIS